MQGRIQTKGERVMYRGRLVGCSALSALLLMVVVGCSKQEVADGDDESRHAQAPALPAGDGNRLNLLILTVDTLRADHLGAYGYAPPTSPAIDRLAEDGTLIEQAFAPRALTWPSLATLMTSRYPVQHGVRRNGVALDESETTLAEILAAKGYATAAYLSENAAEQDWRGFAELQMLEDPEIAGHGIEWLQEAKEDEPFFLWLHFFGAHKPYTPPEEYAERFTSGYSGPFQGSKEYTNAITVHQKKLRPKDLAHIVGLYDALIARTDDLIATVLETLDSLDLAETTLVVFASDHGEDLYEHNRYFFHSASVYDSSLHVPLIFRLPGVVPEGNRLAGIVEMIDVAPSIVNLLGFSDAPTFSGASLVPYFEKDTIDLGPAFSEWRDKMVTVRTPSHRYVWNPTKYEPVWLSPIDFSALRREDFYLRMVGNGMLDTRNEQWDYPIRETELYDIARAPLQRVVNLGAHSEQVAALSGLLQDWQEEFGWKLMGGEDAEIDPDVQERLEALGYVF